jgi:hypothetical protein
VHSAGIFLAARDQLKNNIIVTIKINGNFYKDVVSGDGVI